MWNNLLFYDYYVIVEKAVFISDEQLVYTFCKFVNHAYNTIGPLLYLLLYDWDSTYYGVLLHYELKN